MEAFWVAEREGATLIVPVPTGVFRLPSLHSVGGIRQTVWVQFVGANVDDDGISAGDATAFSVLKRSSREQSLRLVLENVGRLLVQPRHQQVVYINVDSLTRQEVHGD